MTATALIAIGAIIMCASLLISAVVVEERGKSREYRARAKTLEDVIVLMTREEARKPPTLDDDMIRRARLQTLYDQARQASTGR